MDALSRVLVTAVGAVALMVSTTAGPAGGAGEAAAGDDRVVGAAAPAQHGPADLGMSHGLGAVGLNLWRMPLSEADPRFGTPQLLTSLTTGGFALGPSKTVLGDFGEVTGADGAVADQLVWHAGQDGSVLMWVVAGSDPTPRLWAELRGGGWFWSFSHPLAGDFNADGWDDLLVLHRNGPGVNAWMFVSDGRRLPATPTSRSFIPDTYAIDRALVADVSRDGYADLVLFRPEPTTGGIETVVYWNRDGGFASVASGAWLVGRLTGGGWSYAGSRQVIGTVTPGGSLGLVHLHAQLPNRGMLVWGQELTVDPAAPGPAIVPATPQVWQDLRSGGWSWADSRQHLGDTDGDGLDDLVSVHEQSSVGGLLVWRHTATGAGLRSPEVIADLRSGGWSFRNSREDVGSSRGAVTP